MPPPDEFDARLAKAEARQASAKRPSGGVDGKGLGAGLTIAVQIVVGTGVGAGLGWGLDRWLGSKPWLLILGFCLGAAAGLIDAIRTAQRLDREAAARRRDSKEG